MKIEPGKLGKQPTPDAGAYLSAMFSPRAGAQQLEVPISQLIPWSDAEHGHQPFRPYTPEKLAELAENIRQFGILSPVFLRPFGDGYQILAGHNRVAAAKLAGLATVPAVIRELDDDSARLVLVDSNLHQRETILPSEKAWAYRMRMDAMRHQGARTDLTCAQVAHRSAGVKSRDIVAEQSGESKDQIRRFIRLTYLIIPFLDRVDEDSLPFTVGVALSYLTEANQQLLLSLMTRHKLKRISLAQAEELKQLGPSLDESAMLRILDLLPGMSGPSTITLKLPMSELPDRIPKSLLTNAELQRRVAAVVAQFIAEHEVQV